MWDYGIISSHLSPWFFNISNSKITNDLHESKIVYKYKMEVERLQNDKAWVQSRVFNIHKVRLTLKINKIYETLQKKKKM